MARLLSYLLAAMCVAHVVIAENVSNILKLSKSQTITSIATNVSNVNVTEFAESKNESRERPSLVAFSKNNPELDWTNYLRMFDGSKEEHEDLDVDFMKEKLERTANSIQWLADLYDPLRWARVPGKLQDECRRDMERFLDALRDGKLWAAKSKSLIDCSIIETFETPVSFRENVVIVRLNILTCCSSDTSSICMTATPGRLIQNN